MKCLANVWHIVKAQKILTNIAVPMPCYVAKISKRNLNAKILEAENISIQQFNYKSDIKFPFPFQIFLITHWFQSSTLNHIYL